uniref:Pyroglutamyl-peptidase I n=2 Tax=Eukaryota TaxID=2759 RepID=A0A7S3E212_9CHLO|mmetsp:Transcript_13197/g.34096  ORF Transcript_13197/g.34096 Transcript_13197/m.34096 type:complete len:273 (+) Transcript_13197:121-939(+)
MGDIALEASPGVGGAPAGPPVRFFVTGFGTFPGVPANPTEVLVNALGEKGHAAQRLEECSVLRVSAKVVRDHVAGLKARVLSTYGASASPAPPQNGEKALVVVVHFGVDVCATSFKIESRAFNEAHFRLPDVDGFQPQHAPIDEEEVGNNEEKGRGEEEGPEAFGGKAKDLAACLRTDLPCDRVVAGLRAKGHNVVVSLDAGRYVCNYTYYWSLRALQEAREAREGCRVFSVFVHVPSFHAIGAEDQTRFVADLFDQLAEGARAVACPAAKA